MSNINYEIIFVLICLCGLTLVSCEKEVNADGRVHAITQGITDIEEKQAIVHGEVRLEGKLLPEPFQVVSKGLIYGTDSAVLKIKSHSFDINNYNYNYNCFQTYSYTTISSSSKVINIGFRQYDRERVFYEIGGKGFFDCFLINLLHGTKYYVRAFAHISNDWGDKNDNVFNKYIYGNVNEFLSGGITQDPSVFIPINSLGIGIMKEDLEGLYDAMRLPQLTYPYINSMTIGGYFDWRLPTLDELKEIYKLRVQIGGFKAGGYWSGDFHDDIYYYYVDFANGSDGSRVSLKGGFARLVRPLP